MGPSHLSDFLRSQRKRYLADVASGQGTEWTVVMGNEAGDLDSAASSIGYAYLQAKDTPQGSNILPLIQVAREDIHLRPENVYAFEQASLDPGGNDLLCLDDLPAGPFPSNRFVLVDHNRLLDRYQYQGGEAEVIGILDHHEDEGFHLSASHRMIQVPTGSCASLVANHFRDSKSWDPEVAALLLSAMILDTGGLKAGGKATPTDNEAARFLHSITSQQGSLQAENLEGALQALTLELLGRKGDVSHFSNRDLLRRDYKQYQYSSTNLSVSVGLSTIPVDMKDWVPKDPDSIWQWMKERDLMIHGSLTTFRRADKGGKTKHRRQQLWVIREDAPEDLVNSFWESLEAAVELNLQVMKNFKEKLALGSLGETRVRAYKQVNSYATRKVTAPLVKRTIEGYFAQSTS